MTEGVVETRPLSQAERVIDAFIAPSKTFTDILRSTTWIVPFLLLIVVTTCVDFTIDKKVGFEVVASNQIRENPKQQEAMNQVPPEQRAQRIHVSAVVTRYLSYAFPVFVLIVTAVGSLILLACFNFGLGAKVTFGQMFAVWVYASLPRLLAGLLTILTLVLGNNQDTFTLQYAVGTNVGYFLPDVAPWLRSALSYLDFVGLWNVALLVIGTSIVAKVTMSKAAIVVVGLWFLALLFSVGTALATT